MTASSTGTTGTSTVTVTGTAPSGVSSPPTVTHTKTFALTVTAPPSAGTPAAPTVTIPGCINAGYNDTGVNISWTNTGVTWVDISHANDSSFTTPYYHKAVSNIFSTTGSSGFNATDNSGGLSLNSATNYYVRTYNGTQNSQITPFNIPACISATPTPTPTPSPSSPPPSSTSYTVNGFVFTDTNSNGIKDSTESCYAGAVTVHLSGPTSKPDIQYTQDSSCTSQYTFSGLAAGNYTITITPVTNYNSTNTPVWTQIVTFP